MYLLDYNHDVSYWHEQPLRIRFTHGGKVHRYTPDLEVHGSGKKQLIEVKPKVQVDSGKWEVLSEQPHPSARKKVISFWCHGRDNQGAAQA